MLTSNDVVRVFLQVPPPRRGQVVAEFRQWVNQLDPLAPAAARRAARRPPKTSNRPVALEPSAVAYATWRRLMQARHRSDLWEFLDRWPAIALRTYILLALAETEPVDLPADPLT